MAGKGSTKDDSSSSGSRKTTPARPQEQALKCPRCDSQNTKFCYYNNYSLTQPRHFCKTCRRYWTNGGALRNVPIGGGCRKNKKMKSASRLSLDSKDSTGSSDISGLRFFQGLPPAMDFQLGGLNFPRVINSNSSTNLYNQFPSFGDNIPITSAPNVAFNLDPSPSTSSLMGFNFPFSSSKSLEPPAGFQETNPMNYHTNLASSIESLSSLNQDMHWKLQQQRLSMLFGGDSSQKESGFQGSNIGVQIQKPQPILFHNLESSKGDGNLNDCSRKEGASASGNLATEWFFDPTPTSSSGNENVNNWNGIQGWSNLNQYSPLP